ncbi:MAG: hypothetical protein WBR11_03650 [Terriglobales bacterium]
MRLWSSGMHEVGSRDVTGIDVAAIDVAKDLSAIISSCRAPIGIFSGGLRRLFSS